MGRIADALKRAERERHRATEPASGETDRSSSAGAPGPQAPPGEVAPEVAPEVDNEIMADESPCVVEGLSDSLVPFFQRSSLITEQYRSLRTRLLSQNPQYEHRVLAITSAIPKEGKSVTTLNLGRVLAEISHLKILVVDGDFRRSSLARMLNQSGKPGLAEVLSGEASFEEAVHPTPIPNLMFLPAGSTRNRSAAEILTTARAGPTFKRMREEFHYTIVDTPPATTVTDVGIIGQMCNGVIVVVRLNRTAEAAAKRAVRLLQVNNIPITGCMIIGRDAPSGRYYGYGYGYGYYNYYRYYDYYQKREDEK